MRTVTLMRLALAAWLAGGLVVETSRAEEIWKQLPLVGASGAGLEGLPMYG